MTAPQPATPCSDSPTPGTPPPCAACGYQHNPLGWCKANVCADCGLGQHAGPDHYDGCPAEPHHGVDCPGDACRYAQPPADTQQNDERAQEQNELRALRAQVVRLKGKVAVQAETLASRPSADTETLRCGCACCAELANLIRHRRSTDGFCNCGSYSPSERCDCPLCSAALDAR